ncbi:MAG: hypothetical protein LBQ48_05665 [Oscillospiraceae bacterium]|nr:hypothetical protein [Oscillospiraceae bacterium]
MKQDKLRTMVLSAMLVALSFVIAGFGFSLPLPPPFSATLLSHVPTMIACFVSPYAVIATAFGSTFGFLIKFGFGSPSAWIIAARALSHIVFGLFLYFGLKKGFNQYAAFGCAAPIHALLEGILVAGMSPLLGVPFSGGFIQAVLYVTVVGTLIHHTVDSAVTIAAARALTAAKLIKPLPEKKTAPPDPASSTI